MDLGTPVLLLLLLLCVLFRAAFTAAAAVKPDEGGALMLLSEWFLRKLSLSMEMLFLRVFSSSMLSTMVSKALSDSELAVSRLCTEKAFLIKKERKLTMINR